MKKIILNKIYSIILKDSYIKEKYKPNIFEIYFRNYNEHNTIWLAKNENHYTFDNNKKQVKGLIQEGKIHWTLEKGSILISDDDIEKFNLFKEFNGKQHEFMLKIPTFLSAESNIIIRVSQTNKDIVILRFIGISDQLSIGFSVNIHKSVKPVLNLLKNEFSNFDNASQKKIRTLLRSEYPELDFSSQQNFINSFEIIEMIDI